METNFLQYDLNLTNLKFSEINFINLSTTNIKDVSYKNSNGRPSSFVFKDMLLKEFSNEIGIDVLKINLFLTPNQPEFDGLGFLFLKNKTILPVKLEQSHDYKTWANYITNDMDDIDDGGKIITKDWLLNYTAEDCSMKGMSHKWEGKSFTIKDYDVYKETGKFLFENAPNEFNEKKIAAEKNKYLRRYINTGGAILDTKETIELLNKIISAYDAKTIAPSDKLQKHFIKFHSLTGFELPQELKSIYELSNGVEFPYGMSYSIMTIKELLTEWKNWKEIYDEWILEDLKDHESDGHQTLPMYTTPYWIPFMSDGNGNHVAIDYAPGKNGKSGQIIIFGADEEKITVLAENLNVFFNLFLMKDSTLEQYWGTGDI